VQTQQQQSSPIAFAIALAIIILMLGMVRAALPQTITAPPMPVRGAIARALEERLGSGSIATIRSLQTSVPEDEQVTAVPEPGARVGKAARFVLWRDGKRRGVAVAEVDVRATLVRAERAIARDEVIGAADVTLVEGELRDVPVRRLPGIADVVGAAPRRAVAAGEALTSAVLTLPPLVRSGDQVDVNVRVGSVHVAGRGVASGSGHVGDVIRVVNPGSRQPRKAKIIGPGSVEIVQ
jgi:flagella basal body P-ring formation protein FlgA